MKHSVHPLSWVVASAVVAGCSPAATQPQAAAPAADRATSDIPANARAVYAQALDIAKNPTPDAIVSNLTAITPETPKLVWRDIDGERYVLTASWVSTFQYYEPYLGKPYDTGKYDIWVSAAPFVRERCSDPTWRGDDLDGRLRQLLGLPPDVAKVGFASFWVKPADLFRPCPDNEITDARCGLALPDDVEPWYRAWFNDLRARQYFVSNDPKQPGWPWTQLGYTFDWHDLGRPVGVSEFVIRQGSTVVVESLVPTAAFCGVE